MSERAERRVVKPPRHWRLALACVAAIVVGACATAASAAGLEAFVAIHKCEVAEGLRMIAATTERRDPFLILAWPPSSPVQG